MKSQSTIHNKNPKSCQTEDNHLTKQAHYLLPTLEWESGLQRWRARTLNLILRLEKLFASPHCLLNLIHSLFPGNPKFNTQFSYTKGLKTFGFCWKNSTLYHSCGHCHDLRQWISSFYSVPAAIQVWMTQNQQYPNVRFPFIPSLENSYKHRIQYSV